MIVPDINLLIYAYNDQASQHAEAKVWWETLLNGKAPVGLTWLAISGFIRLSTHPRVLTHPLPVTQSTGIVRGWLTQAPVRILQPGLKFQEIFLRQLEHVGVGGNLTTDAQFAALAIEHQAELHSCDADFGRFAGLRWRNPLRGGK
ncbi:type II toxin-antitoxin system VapC family toxin [bacterium]|nr:type II toxin-antitoxin system VapC family toxin [bacterium]